MKSLCMLIEMDKTGGVKLPDVLLELCSMGAGNTLKMHLEGEHVVMEKYPPTCVFCGSEKNLQEYRDKRFCCSCADELKNF